jgi:beta-galactosidase
VLRIARVDGPDQQLPEPVRVKHGTGEDGRPLHYYLNYSASQQSFRYAYGAGSNLLTDAEVRNGQTLELGPWDLAVVRER